MTTTNRRDFLKKLSVAGAGAAGLGALGTVGATEAISTNETKQEELAERRSRAKIQWKLQTYASRDLAQFVIKPSIEAFNKIAGDEMQITLYYSDGGVVAHEEAFLALQDGTLDAVQSDDQSIGSPVDVAIFSGYFPFAFRYPTDVPVLFNQWGLDEVWIEAYNRVRGVTWLSSGAWDPCHLSTTKAIHSVDDLKGLKIFTFPTAGRFLERFGVKPVELSWNKIKPSLQFGDIDGIAWSGITESYTLGWAELANFFLSNHITGAWLGSYLANSNSWDTLPPHLQELFHFCMDSSHYRRQHLYWGQEASFRINKNLHTLTTIPSKEWEEVEAQALFFWEEVSEMSPRSKEVIKILRNYNQMMKKTGPPYRYIV